MKKASHPLRRLRIGASVTNPLVKTVLNPSVTIPVLRLSLLSLYPMQILR